MIRATRLLLFTFIFALLLSGCSTDQEQGLSQRQIEKLVLAANPHLDSPDIWARAIKESLQELNQPVEKQTVCAVIAVIAQESGFKTVPKNSGMPNILRKKIEGATSNLLVKELIQLRLDQHASNGNTFRENIDSIRSERDFELWYNEFTSASITKPILLVFNKDISDLVTTLGSMQVSVKFAKLYPKKPKNVGNGSIREILYTCKGGVFYGSACLLDYKHHYDDWKYVFADYNAGHYASRNAGFQKMLARISREKIDLDGDLLSYEDGKGSPSVTCFTFIDLLKNKGIGFDEEAVKKDFEKEKSYDFEETWSYKTLAAMHKKQFGRTIYAVLPEISLHSPKFVSKNLTTKWFANRVKGRFNHCMRTRI